MGKQCLAQGDRRGGQGHGFGEGGGFAGGGFDVTRVHGGDDIAAQRKAVAGKRRLTIDQDGTAQRHATAAVEESDAAGGHKATGATADGGRESDNLSPCCGNRRCRQGNGCCRRQSWRSWQGRRSGDRDGGRRGGEAGISGVTGINSADAGRPNRAQQRGREACRPADDGGGAEAGLAAEKSDNAGGRCAGQVGGEGQRCALRARCVGRGKADAARQGCDDLGHGRRGDAVVFGVACVGDGDGIAADRQVGQAQCRQAVHQSHRSKNCRTVVEDDVAAGRRVGTGSPHLRVQHHRGVLHRLGRGTGQCEHRDRQRWRRDDDADGLRADAGGVAAIPAVIGLQSVGAQRQTAGDHGRQAIDDNGASKRGGAAEKSHGAGWAGATDLNGQGHWTALNCGGGGSRECRNGVAADVLDKSG